MLKRIASNPTLNNIIGNGRYRRPLTDLLSEGVKINGTYISSRNVRVTGSVEGNIHVEGSLTVEEGGAVNGNVYAGKDIYVAGVVRGDLRSKGRVVVKETAVISGCLYTKSLGIEAKAIVEGEIHMSEAGLVAAR